MSRYINTHCHDEYSNITIKDSTNRLPRMIDYVANTLNQKGFAMTNHEFIGNHLKVENTVKQLKSKGKIPQDFKVILGNEIYLVDEQEMKNNIANKGKVRFYHFILLAKNLEGHKQLRELSKRAWARAFNFRGLDRRPTFYSDIEEVVGNNQGNIIGCTACIGGYLGQSILNNNHQQADDFLNWCLDVFGKDNFFCELQPHIKKFDEEGNEIKTEQQIVNEWIYDTGLPCVISTDAHYLNANEQVLHSSYLKSDDSETVSSSGGRETADFYATTYFMSEDEIKGFLTYLPNEFIEECFDNSHLIWEQCEEYSLKSNTIIPKIPLIEENQWFWDDELLDYLYDNKDDFKHIIQMWESEELYNGYLISLAMRGIVEDRQIPKERWHEVLKRIDLEMFELLGISKTKNVTMSCYFITLHKLLDVIWEEAHCMTGVSRGSAAGWELNYILQIAHEDPLKQPIEMPHWRFLSAERPDFPDIDLDLSSHKRDLVLEKVSDYLATFNSEIVRVATFKKEKSRNTCATACRGYGLPSDVGLFLSSLIPIDRGNNRSLHDVINGNEEEGWLPIKEFINQVNKYPGLLDMMLGIEGLICGRSSHSCGVVISEAMLDHTTIMRAPSGELTTQYDLDDCEQAGLIKFDFLNTKTLGMIQLTFEELIKRGRIEWQGSLRKTYNKFLHPDVIDMENPIYFDKLNNGELISAFQFETGQGLKTLNAIKPHSLLEVANANTLMRLMSDGEQPLDKYVRFKNNPIEWEQEMVDFGLNEEERQLMHKMLDADYGVCSSQEGMMLMVMNEKIANFNVVESNKLRKGVAKKVGDLYDQAHKLFYEKGLELGCRRVFLDYVWDVQIAMQRGYSFSVLHTIGYSIVLLQQLELITSYPKIYWETSVLQIESGAIELETEKEEEGREKITNYEKMGGAIATLQSQGSVIDLPDINIAEKGFHANESTNSIIYGLKGISSINNKTAEIIMANRPYASMKDFHDRLHLVKQEVKTKDGKVQKKALISKEQMINLIKGGAFDTVEPNKTRQEVLEEYLHMEYPDKKSITTSNLDQLINRGLIPSDYDDELMYYDFREYLRQGKKVNDGDLSFHKENGYKVTKSKKWYLLDGVDEVDTQEVVDAFFNMFPELQQGKHWEYVEDNGDYYPNAIWVESGATSKDSFEGVYKRKIARLLDFMRSDDLLQAYNESLFTDVKNVHMQGSQATWEFESLAMYHSDHELAHINKEYYNISNFHDLPTEPVVEDYWEKVDKETGEVIKIPKFKIEQICGVVLGKNKNKSILTLLTESGVVNCKYQSGQFAFYDRSISIPDEETGKNKTVEKSFFQRGTLLMVRGIRVGEVFRAKVYRNSGLWSHSTAKIEKLFDDGICLTQEERYRIED